MGKLSIALIIAMFALLPSIFAAGYGTSTVSLSSTHISMMAPGSTSVNYTVSLASGNQWGTTFKVVSALPTNWGISVAISNPSSETVPFSGVINVTTLATALPGTYNITFAATGDDPSTNNVTLAITVSQSPLTTEQTSINQTNTTNATTVPVVSTAATTINYYPTTGSSGYTTYAVLGLIVLILTAYFLMKMPHITTRLIVVGIALILLGTILWVYADYDAQLQYLLPSIAMIVVGIIVWIAGDHKSGAFDTLGSTSTKLLILGVAIVVIGTALWISADYWGQVQFVTPGIALVIIGTIVWIFGDYKSGAFDMLSSAPSKKSSKK